MTATRNFRPGVVRDRTDPPGTLGRGAGPLRVGTSHRPVTAACKRVSPLVTALILAACGSQPPNHYYTLMPGSADAAASTPAAASPLPPHGALAFRIDSPVLVPAQVDQPQIVVRAADGSVNVLEEQRWVAPLTSEWPAAIGARLSQQLGALDVSHGAAATGVPVYRLQLEMKRFDLQPGQPVLQQASWSLRKPADTGVTLSCLTTLNASGSTDVAAMVSAQRALTARLADAIASVIASMANGGTPACPV